MAAAVAVAMEACSGERLVVFLFVSRILYSVPLSLSYEAAGICFLTVAGLLVEIAVEESPSCLDRFKTRRGASSGILLGTVTMPAVMLSRLIQLERLLSNQFVGIEDFTYTKMQYWTVSMSCLGVVASIYATLQHSSVNHGSISVFNIKNLKFSTIHLVFYIIICYMSLKEELHCSLLASMKILWFLLHGLATVGLIWYLICTFPSCASIGESLLVSSGLILYFGDMLAYTFTRINPSLILSNLDCVYFEQRSEISTILQGILIGLLLMPTVYKLVLYFGTYFTNFTNSGFQVTEGIREKNIGTSVAFYASLFVMLTMVAPSWIQFVHDFQVHPLLWVLNFVFEEAFKRLLLCVYWISIISASVLRFYGISKHSKIERILLRKYYHLVAVAIFSPAVLLQPKFLDLAFGAAFAVFLVLEMIRVWKIWPFGKLVDQFMNAFTDHRDSDILIVSHFSLLLGCALPKWISSGFNDRPLAAFAGILSLGIGDTMASVVGYKYGVLRWSKAGKKTIEGTAAGITSVLVACVILLCLPTSTGYILSQHWSSLLLAVTVSGLLEAHTAQIDNAFIPLVFYSLLCL